MKTSRRSFIKTSMLGTGLFASTSFWSCKDNYENPIVNTGAILSKEDVILFQGDSITDGKRDTKNLNPNVKAALGQGYVWLIANQLLTQYPSMKFEIYNRGLSGNRLPDLQNRWEKDTLAIRPTVLSILIGVNDFWRTIGQSPKTTVEQYRDQYKRLLDETLMKLPNIKLIIGEPFACKGLGPVNDAWFPKFLEYQEATIEVAKEFNGIYIPYQKIFDESQKLTSGVNWTTDGIHPTSSGAELMASKWVESILH